MPLPKALLIAVDFSPCSLRALDTALAWAPPEAEVTCLHVVDTDLALRLEAAGAGSATAAIERMRARGERELEALARERSDRRLETMLVEGVPFIEIVKIARDLDCDLLVLGARSTDAGLQEFLFGSTAEKVLRGARRPVLCVP